MSVARLEPGALKAKGVYHEATCALDLTPGSPRGVVGAVKESVAAEAAEEANFDTVV